MHWLVQQDHRHCPLSLGAATLYLQCGRRARVQNLLEDRGLSNVSRIAPAHTHRKYPRGTGIVHAAGSLRGRDAKCWPTKKSGMISQVRAYQG